MLETLQNPNAWFNVTAGIQMLVAVIVTIGVLIAMPDNWSSRITKHDWWGTILTVVGLGIMAVLLVPWLLEVFSTLGNLVLAVIVFYIFIIVPRRGLWPFRAREVKEGDTIPGPSK